MEGVYEIVPTYEIVTMNEEDLYVIMPKNEGDLCEIVPKYEKDLCTLMPMIEEDVCKIILQNEENLCKLVTKNEEGRNEAVSRNEKSLCSIAFPKDLVLKPSSLPDAIMGIFAFAQIEYNICFGPYVGERLELHEAKRALESEFCWLVSS